MTPCVGQTNCPEATTEPAFGVTCLIRGVAAADEIVPPEPPAPPTLSEPNSGQPTAPVAQPETQGGKNYEEVSLRPGEPSSLDSNTRTLRYTYHDGNGNGLDITIDQTDPNSLITLSETGNPQNSITVARGQKFNIDDNEFVITQDANGTGNNNMRFFKVVPDQVSAIPETGPVTLSQRISDTYTNLKQNVTNWYDKYVPEAVDNIKRGATEAWQNYLDRPVISTEGNPVVPESASNVTVPKTTQPQKFDPNFGYKDISESPLFRENSGNPETTYLNVKGAVQNVNSVKQSIASLCVRLPSACEQNILSPVYHGSSSTSLYNILEGDQTAIVPLSELVASGKPVFSASERWGLLDNGTAGLQDTVSTSAIYPGPAIDYSKSVSWSATDVEEGIGILKNEYQTLNQESINKIMASDLPENEKQSLLDVYHTLATSNDSSSLNAAVKKYYDITDKYEGDQDLPNILQSMNNANHLKNNVQRTITYLDNQLKAYPNLAPWQKDLLDNSYRVVYGIRPDLDHASVFIPSDVNNEIGFKGSFKITEIQNIFVPKSEIPKIENIWSTLHPNTEMPFKLQDIDLLNPNSYLNKAVTTTSNSNSNNFLGIQWNGFKNSNGGLQFPFGNTNTSN